MREQVVGHPRGQELGCPWEPRHLGESWTPEGAGAGMPVGATTSGRELDTRGGKSWDTQRGWEPGHPRWEPGHPRRKPGHPWGQEPGHPRGEEPGHPRGQEPGHPRGEEPGQPRGRELVEIRKYFVVQCLMTGCYFHERGY